jgi:hypothetical protein
VLVCSEIRVLLAAGGWFVLKEKYCCLVADEPSEQAQAERENQCSGKMTLLPLWPCRSALTLASLSNSGV